MVVYFSKVEENVENEDEDEGLGDEHTVFPSRGYGALVDHDRVGGVGCEEEDGNGVQDSRVSESFREPCLEIEGGDHGDGEEDEQEDGRSYEGGRGEVCPLLVLLEEKEKGC